MLGSFEGKKQTSNARYGIRDNIHYEQDHELNTHFSIVSELGEGKGGFYGQLGQQNKNIKVKSFPNPNLIQNNFN
jgi:parallel beta-helix repeat protein